jgi:hypothetical protein
MPVSERFKKIRERRNRAERAFESIPNMPHTMCTDEYFKLKTEDQEELYLKTVEDLTKKFKTALAELKNVKETWYRWPQLCWSKDHVKSDNEKAVRAATIDFAKSLERKGYSYYTNVVDSKSRLPYVEGTEVVVIWIPPKEFRTLKAIREMRRGDVERLETYSTSKTEPAKKRKRKS